MVETDSKFKSSANSLAILMPVGVVMALCIFVGTFFNYFSRHKMLAPGSYTPLLIGVCLFFGLMVVLSYLSSPTQEIPIRIAKAVSIALAVTAVFFLLLLFLVLNTIGS